MGNAALRDLAAIETVPFDAVDGETVAIDTHNWLYRYLTVTVRFTSDHKYTTADGTEVANLIGIIQGLPRLLEHNATPVFVFDGGVTDLKADEVEKRREARAKREAKLEDARERGDQAAIARLDSQTQRLTDTILATSRELLELLDVPIVEAPAEGEAQAAYMAETGQADAVGSEDYDTLLFGAPTTYRDLTTNGEIERMSLAKTLDAHDLRYEQLVDAAILCGTDFNEGVHGIGPKTAVKRLREHGDLFAVLEADGESIPHADRIRELFVNPPVTDDYEINDTIRPDIDAARAFVVDEWEVDPDEVERGFERIEDATTQTGLEEWT